MLKVKNVNAGYGKFQALFDVSLEVAAGAARPWSLGSYRKNVLGWSRGRARQVIQELLHGEKIVVGPWP